jgi:hypothetical protein
LQFSSEAAPSLLLVLLFEPPPDDDGFDELDEFDPPPSLPDELSFLSPPQATSKTSSGIAIIETRTWLRDISPPEALDLSVEVSTVPATFFHESAASADTGHT